MKRFLLLLPLIFIQPAAAQVYAVQQSPYNICDSYTGLNCIISSVIMSPIDSAMEICKRHKIVQNNVVYLQNSNAMYPEISNHPYYYDDKWKSCSKIEEKWNQSETAKRIKVEQEQEQRDLEFINKQAE